MLKRVEFRNFKALRSVDVDLEPLTAIVGPNASGKTSILEGLHFLTQPEDSFRTPKDQNALLLYGRGGSGVMEIACTGDEVATRWYFGPPDVKPGDKCLESPEKHNNGYWYPRFYFYNKKSDINEFVETKYETVTRKTMGFSSLLNLDVSKLSSPYYSETPIPHMSSDGDGLATVLSYVALNQPDTFQLIQTRLRTVVPTVERIRFERTVVNKTESETIRIGAEQITRPLKRDFVTEVIFFDMKNAPNIPASQVSEGTLLVLGLLTALMGPDRPKLLLLDDLDHGLHPKAQREVVTLLRQIQSEDPGMQIIMTTHSPYLLDNLQPEEVRLTMLNDDGSASCKPLIDHPDFDRWKDEMSPGEMWSLFGEQWVATQASKG